MTFLQVINKVLVRLREDKVETIASDDYAVLIGEFVNDANKFVEDAWNFSGLRSTEVLLTTPAVQNYPLTSLDNHDIITTIFNNDTMQDLTEITSARMRYLTRRSPLVNNVSHYAKGYAVNGVPSIDLYGIPATVTELSVDVIKKSAPFEDEEEMLRVPMQPVLYLALAYAARERGEVQGQPTAELFALADKYLSDAIAHDAANFPDETMYEVV